MYLPASSRRPTALMMARVSAVVAAIATGGGWGEPLAAQQASACADTIRQSAERVIPVPSGAQVRKWTLEYYPSLVLDTSKPTGLVVGFVVDERCRVVRHSVGFLAPRAGTVTNVLQSLFPDLEQPGRDESTGIAAPFAAVHDVRTGSDEPRLSVVWLRRSPSVARAAPSE
jgi:hypothetical protein